MKAYPYDLKTMDKRIAAERAFLGALIVDNRAMRQAFGIKAEHFYGHRERQTFCAISRILRDGNTADLVTINRKLKDMRLAEADVAFLAGLVETVPVVATIRQWCAVIRKKVVDRSVVCPLCLSMTDGSTRKAGAICGDHSAYQTTPCVGRVIPTKDYVRAEFIDHASAFRRWPKGLK